MNNQWTTAQGQLNRALACERTLRQARRRQRPSVGQFLRQGWAAMLRYWSGLHQSPGRAALSATPRR